MGDCLVSRFIDKTNIVPDRAVNSRVSFLFSAQGIVSVFIAVEWAPLFLRSNVYASLAICHGATALIVPILAWNSGLRAMTVAIVPWTYVRKV